MADFTRFRTSMGGFNRSDVTNYIETLCAEHAAALRQLRLEKETASAQAADLTIRLQQQEAENEALQKKLEETQTALDSTETALTEAMSMIEELEAKQAEEPEAPAEQAPDYTALELEAYRRAEATERLAAERADRLKLRLGDLLDHISARYEQAGQEIQVLSEDLRTNLQRLQETLSDLELIFDDTTGKFDGLEDEDLTEE